MFSAKFTGIVHAHALQGVKNRRRTASRDPCDLPHAQFFVIKQMNNVKTVEFGGSNRPVLGFFVLAGQVQVVSPPHSLLHGQRSAPDGLQGRHTGHQATGYGGAIQFINGLLVVRDAKIVVFQQWPRRERVDPLHENRLFPLFCTGQAHKYV